MQIHHICPYFHLCVYREVNMGWGNKERCVHHRTKTLVSPEMAKPEKPTARTKNVMATPLVCEKPTTSSRVASIPNPESHTFKKGKEINEQTSMLTPERPLSSHRFMLTEHQTNSNPLQSVY